MYEKKLYTWADKISQHSGSSLEMLMPSMSGQLHALCASLMPADLDIDLMHQGQVPMPDSQIWMNCSLTHD